MTDDGPYLVFAPELLDSMTPAELDDFTAALAAGDFVLNIRPQRGPSDAELMVKYAPRTEGMERRR